MDVELVVNAACVGASIFAISFLDKYPMPHFEKHGMPDVKFYIPPHVAMAIAFFSARTSAALYTTFVGILAATATTIAVVEFGQDVIVDPMLLRAVAVGAATLAMGICKANFPPAGAIAVLFVDNPILRGHGRTYLLSPGLTGAVVLVALAFVKVKVMNAVTGKQKVK